MSLLGLLLHLMTIIFNKFCPSEQKRIYYEIGNQYQIEMNVSAIGLRKIKTDF
mgnify:FL=1|jgi:hypothetical protein